MGVSYGFDWIWRPKLGPSSNISKHDDCQQDQQREWSAHCSVFGCQYSSTSWASLMLPPAPPVTFLSVNR